MQLSNAYVFTVLLVLIFEKFQSNCYSFYINMLSNSLLLLSVSSPTSFSQIHINLGVQIRQHDSKNIYGAVISDSNL